MAAELLQTGLPAPWNFGVLQDGRVFFINENSKSTTWLHPVHNHPIQSGFISVNDLPRGWELAFTPESVPYYIDHINLRTSFIHPVTGESELPVHEAEGTLPRNDQSPPSANQKQNFKRASIRRKSNKQKLIDKPPALRRSAEAPVTIKGWLYKQEGGGLKSWKKRWFVLSDFCLYYYKGSEEDHTVGALLLPSYKIDYCNREDGINKKFAFKAEHQNMRTCYFATDTLEDQTRWIKALTLAAFVQTDPDTDFNRNRSSEGFDQTQAKVPLNYSQSSDQDFSHPKASDTGGFNETRPRDYPPNLRHSGNDQLPQDRTYSTNLESTRISDRGSGTNLSQEDTGGFGEPRLSPRDRPSAFGPPNLDNIARPDQEAGGSNDTNNSTSNQPSRLTEENMAMLGRQMSNRNSYDPGPRARSSFDPNPYQQQNMRNSYGSQDPRYQEPQRLDRGRPGSAGGAFHQDPSQRDPRNYARDSRSEPRMAPGQRNSDLESISSRGSQRIHPRDQNYNVPKASTSGSYMPGQPYGSKPANGYSVNNTFEQSGDSTENTLDRSFDSSQQLPGYDSFRKEKPDPAVFRRSDSNTGSLHRNPNEVHKTDSLRHLQEWTKSQATKPRSRPSSSYSNASDRPLSDGRRIYSSSNPPSERSSVKGMPSPQDTHPGQSHRSPPPERLNLNVASAQNYSQGGPSATSTSEIQESHPDRPPIPAAYREQYIKELAETKTPHTRNDLLSSIQIQRLRQHEPLVFQYPEVSPPAPTNTTQVEDRERHLLKESKAEPVTQSRPQPRAQMQREGPSRPIGSPRPQREQFTTPQRNIETIKEDPAMSDQDTLTTKTLADLQQHLSGHRMRLSIAAGDLSDKSHEELVLLLIQLRRDQSKLEHTRDFYRSKLNVGRPNEKDYKIRRKSSIGRLNEVVENEHDQYVEIRKMYDELENQLEVTKPLLSLLDNMVRMGSLYGGNNLMLASQYKRHKLAPGEYTAPKKMILFSRQYQEEKLTKEKEEELRQLEADEIDLEEKLQQLYKLDRDLQERSLAVMTLQTSKDRMEKNVNQLRKDIQMTEDHHQAQRLKQQLRPLEGELAVLRQQLSESSKVLEEISRQDAKVENEVMLLRKKIYGINRNQHSPTLPVPGTNVRAREKLSEELEGIRSIMDTMSLEQGNLSHQITSLRHSTPDLLAADSKEKSGTSYMQTDLDSGQSQDISKESQSGFSRYDNTHNSSLRVTRSEATSRDRSKSAPPPVEREILPQQEQKVVTAQVRRDQFTPISREASIASSQSVQRRSHSHDQRDNTRSSTGSHYASIPRSQSSQPQSANMTQTTYQQQVLTRGVQNGGLDLHGPAPSSSRSSSSRDDHRPGSRDGFRPGTQPGDDHRPGSRNSNSGGNQHKDGLYRAQIRMVTPEPTEQNRYRGEQSSASSSASSSNRERSLTASQQGYGHQYGSQVGVKVKTVRQVAGETRDLKRVSEYVNSLDTPEAREQRSYDIMEDSHQSITSADLHVGVVKDDMFSISKTGSGLMHAPTNPDLDLIVVKSVHETGQRGIEKKPVEEQAIVSEKASTTGDRGRPMMDADATKLEEQERKLTKKRILIEFEKRLLEEQKEENSGARTATPPSSSYVSHPDSRHRESHAVQRTDSRTQKLTSNLAMSLIEGKEQVIRASLKRVASDASDFSSIRGSSKPTSERGLLYKGEYKLREDLRKKLQEENAAESSLMLDVDRFPSNTSPDFPFTANPVVVARSVSSDSSSSTSSDSGERSQKHLTLNVVRTSNTTSHKTNREVAVERTVSKGIHVQSQGEDSKSGGILLQDRVNLHGQRSGSHEQIYGSKPMSEVRPQQQYHVHRVEQQSVSVNKQGPVQGSHFQGPDQVYMPIELSEADDNTKKFFGLVPKDAARTQTVRDVKKKESERRSRERKRFYVNVHGPADMEEAAANEEPQDFRRTQSLPRRVSAPVYSIPEPHTHDDSVLKRRSVGVVKAKKAQQVESRQSAAERLFGGGRPSQSPSPVPSPRPSYTPQTTVSTRTSSIAGQPWHSTGSEHKLGTQPRPTSVATVRPVPTNRAPRANSADLSVTMKSLHVTTNGHSSGTLHGNTGGLERLDQRALDEEERKVRQYWADRLKSRHTPRGRFMTISSTQPVKMESPQKVTWKPDKVHSAAGEIIGGRWREDVHEVVLSEPVKDFQYDDTTIDREVLFVPEKVDIPERYIHESETEEESEEQRMRRFEKATQIKRMLAAQSLAETGVDNHGYYRTTRHSNPALEAELHRREKLLDLKQELAYQVTQKSKEVAGNKPENTVQEPTRAFTSRVTIGSLSPPPTPTGGIPRRRIRTLSQDRT